MEVLRPLLAAPSVRFCITGVLNTAIHYLTATALFVFLQASPAAANGAAFIVATIFSCVMNTLWSFSRRLDSGVFARFWAVSLFGCGLAMLVATAAARLGVPNQLGIVCVVLVVTPATYTLHRKWTYR